MLYFTTSLPMYVEVLVCVVEVVEVVEVVVEVKDPLGASFSASLAQAQKSEQAWRKPKSWSEPGASRLVYHSTNCSQLEPTAHNSNHQPNHIAIPDLYLIDIYTIHTYHTYISYIHTILTHHHQLHHVRTRLPYGDTSLPWSCLHWRTIMTCLYLAVVPA